MWGSNNLGAARMTPLQTAVFAASWERDYYTLHPERKPGVFQGNQHTGKVVADFRSITTSVADTFGISEHQARKILSAGKNLIAEEIALLEGATARVTLADLQALSKADLDTRAVAIARFATGEATKLARALKPAKPRVEHPVEAGFKALRDAWTRATKADRKKFLGVEGKVIFDLLRDLGAGKE